MIEVNQITQNRKIVNVKECVKIVYRSTLKIAQNDKTNGWII